MGAAGLLGIKFVNFTNTDFSLYLICSFISWGTVPISEIYVPKYTKLVHTHAHMHARTHAFTHACALAHIRARMHPCTHAHMHVHTHHGWLWMNKYPIFLFHFRMRQKVDVKNHPIFKKQLLPPIERRVGAKDVVSDIKVIPAGKCMFLVV